ncbi:MAG: lipoate--protein ligase [Spirochaetaceae bacterium]|jgi:lipoate-protein ligase A|nr:lipoate--protein ligase [Spirochaetaceae bacterium]
MTHIFTTENHNPWYNLAIENWLFHRNDLEKKEILFIHQNEPSVIIGRFQNPWLECRLAEMKVNNINFVRRHSGGGAVYHDLGNSNFTFISPGKDFSRSDKTNLIINALNSLGITAIQGKRYDIYVQGKKVSGSASKFTSKGVIHHGTLLLNADLEALNNYLSSIHYKNDLIKSKGINSVRSEVGNLIDLNQSVSHENMTSSIINQIEHEALINIEIEKIKLLPEIDNYYKKLISWDWLFGNTPGFFTTKNIIDNGKEISVEFYIKKGIIAEIKTDNSRLNQLYLNQPCNILFTS